MLQKIGYPLFVLIFLTTACTNYRIQYENITDGAVRDLTGAVKQTPNAWPGFNLNQQPIMFVSKKEKLLLRYIKGEKQELDYKSWQSKIQSTDATFDTFKETDKKILIIHLDNFKDLNRVNIAKTVAHEAFHFYQETNWKKQSKEQGRGNIYPLQAMPRYYRWEMKDSLLAFLRTGKTTHLGQYTYWFNKWKINLPEEYKNYTDRIEGSAQFYTNEIMATLRSQIESKKISPTDNVLQSSTTNKDFDEIFNLSYESYVLGTLSGICLEKLGNKKWKDQVKLGKSSLEVLANMKKMVRDPFSGKMQSVFLNASVREMEKIDKDGKLDKIISQLASPKTLKVIVPSKGLQFSSFSTKGMYRSFFDYPGIKGIQMVRLTSKHHIKGKNFELNYHPGDHWVTAKENPCSTGHATILMFEKNEIKVTPNRLEILRKPQSVLPGKYKLIEKTQWFCVAQAT